MKTPARRFVLILLGLVAALVGGPVLLNYLVDPYDRFGNNRMGIYISAEREVKSTEVGRFPHDALLMGNSRFAMIPPDGLKGYRFFNGAFPGATAEEIFWFLHHHARKQDLVVLGIDLGMQDPPVRQGDRFRRDDWDSALANLVSLQTLEYSLRTLFSHWGGKPSHARPDGYFQNHGWMKWASREDSAFSRLQLEGMKRHWSAFVPPLRAELSFHRKISETLRERGIVCVAVVPPLHGEVVRHIGAAQLRTASRPWLDEVRVLFPHMVDLSTSTYGAPVNFFSADPGHFKPDAGIRFINEEVVPVAMRALRERGR